MPRTTISDPSTPRAYPVLWGGTASANLADGITLAVGPLLAATLTRDPALVAGLVVAQRLPWFLFVLFAGVIVDRFDRRMLLIAGNALRFIALGGVTLALATGVRELWILYVAAFLLGVAETIVDNASLAILPELVIRDRTSDANGRLFATQSILNELVGPPVGALIFALSAVGAFASGSAAFLLAALVYALLPRRVRQDAGRSSESVWTSLRVGVSWFVKSRVLVIFSIVAAVSNFATSAALAVLVLFAQDRLGIGVAGYGLLLAAAAVGGIPGGLLGPALVRRVGEVPAVLGGTLLAGFAYLIFANTTSPIVAGATMVVEAFAFTVSNVVVITMRQHIVPNALLGRVTSAYRLIAIGVMPLGALAGGFVARGFGLPAPFWMAGILLSVLALALMPFLRTAKLRALPPGDPDPVSGNTG